MTGRAQLVARQKSFSDVYIAKANFKTSWQNRLVYQPSKTNIINYLEKICLRRGWFGFIPAVDGMPFPQRSACRQKLNSSIRSCEQMT